jgi:hypothetical protein
MNIAWIQSGQNRDGGWGYSRSKSSRTEPTAFALLAHIAAAALSQESFRHGVAWLRSCQRTDGGWAVSPGVNQSTSVTALPLLLPDFCLPDSCRRAAAFWLAAQTGRESSWTARLRSVLINGKSDDYISGDGWPWVPGTAGWTEPTCFAMLALSKYLRLQPDKSIRDRVDAGRTYLLARRCADGGWNHGSSQALGYDIGSYPESTGLALTALAGVRDPRIDASVAKALTEAQQTSSAIARNWLTIGLAAHGRRIDPLPGAAYHHGSTVVEASVAVLADAARNGRNVLLT